MVQDLRQWLYPFRFAANVNAGDVNELVNTWLLEEVESDTPLGSRGIALARVLAEALGFGDALIDVMIRMRRSASGEPEGVVLRIHWSEDAEITTALQSIQAAPYLEFVIDSEELARVLAALEERPLHDMIYGREINDLWLEGSYVYPEKVPSSFQATNEETFSSESRG